MRWTKNLVLFLLVASVVGACVKQPEYSVVPHIDLLDVTFRKGNLNVTPAIPDTLIFRVKFSDGDGDLGITSSDSASINYYSPWYYVYNPTTSDVRRGIDYTAPIPAGYKLINYAAKKLQLNDTLPDLNCENWQPIRNSNGQISDTIYMWQNLRAYNMNVDVSLKDNNGVYKRFDPFVTYGWPCNPNLFRSTFPNLSNSNDRSSPLDGVITFRIQSYEMSYTLGTHTLEMDISIKDRAFHTSNIIVKKDFTLQQITK